MGEEIITIPEINIGEFMLNRMEKYALKEALVDANTNQAYTYLDVCNRIKQLSAGLANNGMVQGDVLAMVMPNSVEYPIVFYAVARLGGVFLPLNPMYTQDELEQVFRDYNVKFLVTMPPLLTAVKSALGNTSVKIIVLGQADNYISYDDMLKNDGVDVKIPQCNVKETTVALFLSSGTTGRPKAVQLGHYGLIANIEQIFASNPFPEGDRQLVFLPMYHIYSILAVTSGSLAHGARLVVMSKFNFVEYMTLIGKHQITTLHVVPPILVHVAKLAGSSFDLSSVRKVYCGAAPLSLEVETAVKIVLKLDVITQGFAMTETGVTFCNRDDRYRSGSCGQKLAQVHCKILDPNSGEEVGVDVDGEVVVKGPQVALGYKNRPEETANTFTDGWVRTGDIGHLDADGYLFITDRLKELIKFKGFQVAPASLEDILLRHAGIADAGVVGVHNKEAGELPKAFVVLKPGFTVSESDIVKFVEDRVAPHMRLRGGVSFVSEIPKSPSGKILRRVLKQKVNSNK